MLDEATNLQSSGRAELQEYYCGVQASSDICENADGGELNGIMDFLAKCEEDINETKIEAAKEVLKVRMNCNGYFGPDLEKTRYSSFFESNWTCHIQPALDIMEQNLEIYKTESGSFRIRSIKNIRTGDKLTAWFSREVAEELGIPFLCFANVVGPQHYLCHICTRSFERPNPLKAHLLRHALLERLTLKFNFDDFQCKVGCSIPYPEKPQSLYPILEYIQPMTPGGSPWPFAQSSIHMRGGNSPFNGGDCFMEHLPLRPFYQENSNPSVKRSTFCGFNSISHHPLSLILDSTDARFQDFLSKNPKSSLEEKYHKCPFCGKTFGRKYALTLHVRVHTGSKPLLCKICQRPFSDPSNLNKHMRRHSEEPNSYKCDICGVTMSSRRDLQHHLMSRHYDTLVGSRPSIDSLFTPCDHKLHSPKASLTV